MIINKRRRSSALVAVCVFSFALLAASAVGVASAADGTAADFTPTSLTCEYRVNPMGIDVTAPRLSWILKPIDSTKRGLSQTAYQILVASSVEKLAADEADLWDSGKVTSGESLNLSYAGKPLASFARCYWKVRVWDQKGDVSPWSKPGFWSLGILTEAEWVGNWIAFDRPLPEKDEDFYQERPAPLLRKAFSLDRPVQSAHLYITAAGYYDLHCNGKAVNEVTLDPGWTTYSKRCLYSTYDVTSLLEKGENVLAVELGNGWYNPLPMKMWGRFNLREALPVGKPRFLTHLRVELEDGTVETIVSDTSWKTTEGPSLRNSVYLGEEYDARREIAGWRTAGFDDAAWRPAVKVDSPGGRLHAQMAPAVRVHTTYKPIQITEPKPGVFVVDFGTNFSGVAELSVEGPSGTTVSMLAGERIYEDGTVNPMTGVCGQIKSPGVGGPGSPDVAVQKDRYTLKGEGLEVYRPRFTFHGLRYIQVEGFPGRPTEDNFRGIHLSTALEPTSCFECSNAMFNRINRVFRQTLLSNVVSVQSDCPAREKFGYGGDIVACGEAAIWNFDMVNFYQKVTWDFQDAARESGALTETAPFVGIDYEGLGPGAGPIGWGTAHPLLQYHLLQHYGNRRLVEEQYETTLRWIQLLESKAKDNLIEAGIGDHESLVPKSIGVSGTSFYYYNVRLAEYLAKVLGKTPDAERFAAQAEKIATAFNEKYLDPATGKYDTGTQANQSFAFYMGLVPESSREKVFQALLDDVKEKDNHLSAGIFGTKYLLQVLRDQGRPDVAYKIADQKTYPSWGFMLENGATTLWETWAESDNTFSNDHPMFGSISTWFFRCLGGIRPARDALGMDRVVIEPYFAPELDWAKASYDSVRGTIASRWKRDGDYIAWTVVVPVGTTAYVAMPGGLGDTMLDGVVLEKLDLTNVVGLREIAEREGKVACQLGSGEYRFRFKKETP